MWRSLFYAVGVAFFFTGVQGLVLDHVLIPKDTKLQKLVRKVLDADKPSARKTGLAGNNGAGQPASVGANPTPWNVARQPQQAAAPSGNQQQAQGYGVNTGSRFGPSRFAGPRYGTGYGGGRVGSGAQAGSTFGGFQNQTQPQPNAQLASYNGAGNTRQPAQRNPVALQKLQVREWMPWSLLASGAIIFLYTRTLHRRSSHD